MTIPQRQKEYGRNKKEKRYDLSKVMVQEGKFEKALRDFKRKIEANGLLQDLRDRQQYDKPSIQRKLAKGRAKARWRKHLRSQTLPEKLY